MPTATITAARIGPYRVLARVHDGNFSVVYRCRDSSLPRQLAVKTARPDAADPAAARRRLRREARLRAAVRHPHILELYRVVRAQCGPLLVSPWLAGGTLAERVRGAMQPAEVLPLAAGLAGALDALHAAGWLHGDVSAGNVLFDGDGRALLADFGTARRVGERGFKGKDTATFVTTPHVTAPEVWTGQRLDGRSDLYSLAVLLYLALTGVYPFDADSLQAIPELHCTAPVPPPSAHSPHVGPATEAVLLRGLAKSPAARFASGAALTAALGAALRQDGVLVRPQSGRAAGGAVPPAAAAERPFDETAVRAAGEQLERFAATLDERERAALSALLESARTRDARAVAEATGLTTQLFGPAAALLALEETGAAAALADRPRTAADTAAACGVPERTLAPVLDVLAAVGLLGREDDRFALPPDLATLYRTYGRTGGAERPIRTAFDLWAHLPRWAATGEPFLEMDHPDGAVYSHVVGVLGTLYAGGARELAAALQDGGQAPPGAAVLDVGAGSGVWSLAVAAADPGAVVTALDREQVLETTRAYAEAAGVADRLRTVAGDWRDAPLPEAGFDVAVLANICHLEPGWEIVRLLRRVHTTLRPGGTVVIVDTIPDRRATADARSLLQGLRLGLRTPGGGVHDRASYTAWLEQAGFVVGEALPLRATEGRLTALPARRAGG